MPTPSGVIYLIKNAVVDRTYQHTIDFKDASEQIAYWRSLAKYSLYEYSYFRKQREFIKVDKSLEDLDDVNYIVFRSKDGSRLYYAFVTDKEYITESASYIYYQLDVLQTYLFDYKINPSYIIQEHTDRWRADLSPIYSRTEEDLEYGSEYTVESAYKVKQPTEGVKWFIIIATKPTDLIDSGAVVEATKVNKAPTPFVYYLVPFVEEGGYFGVDLFGTGGTIHVTDLKDVFTFMLNSAFGQYVKQIVYLPYCPIVMSIDESESDGYYKTFTVHNSDIVGQTLKSDKDAEETRSIQMAVLRSIDTDIDFKLPRTLATMKTLEGLEGAVPPSELWESIKANPSTTERDKRFESKLLTYPYRYNLLTDWRNQPIVIKNEYIGTENINLKLAMSISFNTPARYYIEGYKKDKEGRGSSLSQELPLTQPVLSDAYYSYMLQNQNQIKQNVTNAIVAGITNIVTGGITGALGGGGTAFMGSGLQAVNSGVSIYTQIASENAKQKDIKNYPDTVITSDDCSLAILDDNMYVTFYRYKICCEFEEQLAQYFHMYGYKCKRVKVPNLRSRKRFNYIRTIGANISGAINQHELSTIRAIFDNGITFWHYDSQNFKPLDYSYENIEVSLL